MQDPAITFSELLAAAAGELEPAALAALESRLAALPSDLSLYNRLCHTIQTMHADDSIVAPASAIAHAKSLFRAAAQSPFALWLDTAKNIMARLRLDTGGQVTVAGLRGVAEGRHMILDAVLDAPRDAQNVELDLQLSPPASGSSLWTVRAHLEGGTSPCESAAITLHGSSHILDIQPADTDGDVEFELPPGCFDLIFKINDTAVRVGNLTVGQADPTSPFDDQN